MPLTTGTRIGPYEIVSPLGAGGMGEVYRARDTKLNRDVALKILPDAFAGDADRIARFTREAQTLATLNHPRIAQLHGLEDTGSIRALVMELVDGEDLAERIARGAIPLDEALPIAKQIAEALEAAHEKGIIHRDLKPANIKLTPDGTVKILDFGLAKAAVHELPHDAAQSPTFTAVATQMGVILGTAAYMSPEQARGKAVDKRADIWAFGVVLYEMLTGKVLFTGDTVSDTIAEVLKRDVDLSALPSATPRSVRRLLRRCLVRDHRHRLSNIDVARFELADDVDPDETTHTQHNGAPGSRWVALALAFAAGVAATALGIWQMWPEAARSAPVHLSITIPQNHHFSGGAGTGIVISPDGAHVAYTADSARSSRELTTGAGNVLVQQLVLTGSSAQQLFLRALATDETQVVINSAGAYGPFFSPDGQHLGFTRSGKLWRVPVTGGQPFEIGPVDSGDRGTVWMNDGYIYSGGGSGLSRIAETGGARVPLTKLDAANGEVAHRFPTAVPGRHALVFTIFRGALDHARLAVLDLETRAHRLLLDRPGHYGRFLDPGHLLYLHVGTLMAMPFDAANLTPAGAPSPVLNGVLYNNGGAAHFDVSRTGTLVFASEHDSAVRTRLLWVPRDGQASAAPAGPPEAQYIDMALALDGSRLALLSWSRITGSSVDIWDFARGAVAARLQSAALRESLLWSADGETLFFTHRREGVGSVGVMFRQRADGAGEGAPISSDAVAQNSGSSGEFPISVSADGAALFFASLDGMGVIDLKSAQRKMLLEGMNSDPRISPDGRWLAYVDRARQAVGREPNVFVSPYPDVTRARWAVSVDGGSQPRWSADGRELLYLNDRGIFAASLHTTTRDLQVAPPREVYGAPSILSYAVHPDRQRLLVLQAVSAVRPMPRVILNWHEELKRRVSTR